MNDAREAAQHLINVGRLLNDPRSTGFGLNLLSWIALISDCHAEALEFSEQSLAVAVTPWDRTVATLAKACALMLLRKPEQAMKLLQTQQLRITADGDFYSSIPIDLMFGVHKILQGNFAKGIHDVEELISQLEKKDYRAAANSYRLNLADIYLRIIVGNEKPPLPVLLKNLSFLLMVIITGSSRIRALIAPVLNSPHIDLNGFQAGKSRMILGLLYKAKKKRVLALEHLREAQRILSQFGQTPILTRVETALAELAQ